MRYQGSEALDMEYAERRRARQEQQASPSFEVVSGGGLDARARRGVSHQFLFRVAIVCAVAAVALVVGLIRVVLSSATVSVLRSNSSLKSDVSEAQTLNDNLKIERSVLTSSTRISRIATQNYGMVLSSDEVTVYVGDAAQEHAEQEAAAEAEAAAEQAAAEQAEADAAAEQQSTDALWADEDAAQDGVEQIMPAPEA